jgi:hypothetical protein
MPDRAESERLRRDQAEQADRERRLAERSLDGEERAIHARRSEKAAYLEEKLEEQKRSPDHTD